MSYAQRARGGMSEQDQWDADGIPQCDYCGEYGHPNHRCPHYSYADQLDYELRKLQHRRSVEHERPCLPGTAKKSTDRRR